MGPKLELDLTPLEKTVINTSTQEKYSELMRVFECMDLIWWGSGYSPTKLNHWKKHKQETCLLIGACYPSDGTIVFDSKSYYLQHNYKILTPSQFYSKQRPKITHKILEEINSQFSHSLPSI